MIRQPLQVGDFVRVDGVDCIVTRTGVYVNSSHDERETGVNVKPVAGGRARPVALWRVERMWH